MRKRKKNSGEAYINTRGILQRAKFFKPSSHLCRYKCGDNISVDEREKIFHAYWKLGSWDFQTSFIISCVQVTDRKRKVAKGKGKSCTNVFMFNGYRVCRNFFQKTLDISDGRVTRALLRCSSAAVSPADGRGRRSNHSVLPCGILSGVRDHIESFPRYSSHYSRNKNPDLMYLNSDLNITKMFEMYKEFLSRSNS